MTTEIHEVGRDRGEDNSLELGSLGKALPC